MHLLQFRDPSVKARYTLLPRASAAMAFYALARVVIHSFNIFIDSGVGTGGRNGLRGRGSILCKGISSLLQSVQTDLTL
jgi:hypothetical protein